MARLVTMTTMTTVPEVCERAGLTSRITHYAIADGLIDVEGPGGIGRAYSVRPEEAARVIRAAEIGRQYDMGIIQVLRLQRDGRLIERDGGVWIAPTHEPIPA